MNTKFLNGILIAGVLISSPIYPRERIINPYILENWLMESFTYKEEELDYWKTPEETVKDKGGDCEDFSFLVEHILKDLGYETKVIWVYGLKDNSKEHYSHAICLFKKDGAWQYFSNQSYIQTRFNTIAEAVEYDCPNWWWYSEISLQYPKVALKKVWREK